MCSAKKVCALFCILILNAAALFCLELTFRLSPGVTFPVDTDSRDLYSLGFTGAFNADFTLQNFFSVGPEVNYFYLMPRSVSEPVHLIGPGANVSAHFFPISRLKLQAGFSGGPYVALHGPGSYASLWWKGGADIGFRFSPSFMLGVSAGYTSFVYPKAPLYSGLLAGLSLQYTIDTQVAAGNVSVKLDQGEPVFPLFYTIYKQTSIGTLTLVNNENAEIRNVTVSFRAGNYTASLLECGKAELIRKRESADFPLYADFAPAIQNFTENGKMPGEVVVTYELLGDQRTISKTVVLPVYNRNTVRWTEPAVIASYISPTAPEVLDYGKYAVGIARDKLRSGLNRNMQFAMFVFEGLKIGGLSFSNDSSTPYLAYHLDPEKLDYIQYPFQTLAYHSGDYDDLGILFAAVCESVGIRTAMIPLKNDFIVAISLGITAADAENLFSSTDRLLTIADEIWIPISFSVLREGFINSWYKAIQNVNDAVNAEENVDFIILSEAWKTYPPASITGSEASFQKPLEASVARAVDTDLMRYITAEFGPKIKAIQQKIQDEGGSPQLYNQLGLLYVRAGMYEDAKASYRKSATLKSVPAMVNLGNISLLEKDYKTADEWFRKALELQPDNKGALSGINRTSTELEQ
jgi:tetratricopeptide (TPR) repeat protein